MTADDSLKISQNEDGSFTMEWDKQDSRWSWLNGLTQKEIQVIMDGKQYKTTSMTSNPLSSDFSYKKYSLEQLDNWVHDALNCEDLTPQDIYDTIVKCVDDSVEYHKNNLTKSVELLSLSEGSSFC
jgi:hypothetical protein